jgi:hypothetical protein
LTQQIQPEAHLDADQMSVFVEGAATAREREKVLAHLARCGECRDAVFLLQAPASPATPVPTPKSVKPARLRWFVPLGLAGAALAAGITTVILLRPHQPAPAQVHEEAAVNQPARTIRPPAHSPSQPVPNQPARPRDRLARPATQDAKAAVPLPHTGANVGGLVVKQPDVPVAGAAAAPTPVPAAAGPPNVIAPASPVASTKPMPPAGQPTLATGGRSFAKLEQQKPLPALRIEHDRGPDDGSSQVNGRVLDMSDALIPGATVTLRDSTGVTRQATTAGDGTFNFSGVQPGHYDLTVSSPGFEMSKQAIVLKPRDVAELNSVLQVGASTETVEVTSANAPSLQTDSAEVSAVISRLPSHLPPTSTVTQGTRLLSLDSAGTLFLSRNNGKSWKKVKPAWSGKVVDIELTSLPATDAAVQPQKRKSLQMDANSPPGIFQLTTDSGAQWISEDGTHWRTQ